MSLLFSLAKPILHNLNPETAHNLTLGALEAGLYTKQKADTNPQLENKVAGLTFANPIGLAAGFDKNAQTMRAMFGLSMGFTEIGTVTPRAQAGNPKPRVFRDPGNQAVINRMGFPNAGLEPFRKRLTKFLSERQDGQIVGINIGKNKDTEDHYEDYVTLIKQLGSLADYMTVNVSSPNTPGLRDLQKVEFLEELIDKVFEAREYHCSSNKPPIFFKFAPDLETDHLSAIAQLCVKKKVEGVILTNTTLDRPADLSDGFKDEQGGLSGAPLTQKSTDVISAFYAEAGKKVAIIGAGGIMSAEDAYTKIKAGASLIQLYTGLIYKGPALIKEIHEELGVLLKKDNFSSLSQAVGAAHKRQKKSKKDAA